VTVRKGPTACRASKPYRGTTRRWRLPERRYRRLVTIQNNTILV